MTTNLCLVLTSTIAVDHPEFIRRGGRIDTETRLLDYTAALSAWMTRQDAVRDIVFVDNSGYPLDALQAVVDRHAHSGKRVELISFRTAGYTPERGRSFGELDILDTALQRSVLLREAEAFAKVTGRVFVPNADAILTTVARDFDIVGTLSHNLTWLDTVFVLFRRELFRDRLLPHALERVNDWTRHHVERVLASAALHAIAEGARWYPFPRHPRLLGIRGIDGAPYPSGRIRARAVDFFAWGHHRSLDVATGAPSPHPMDRWTAPRDQSGSSEGP